MTLQCLNILYTQKQKTHRNERISIFFPGKQRSVRWSPSLPSFTNFLSCFLRVVIVSLSKRYSYLKSICAVKLISSRKSWVENVKTTTYYFLLYHVFMLYVWWEWNHHKGWGFCLKLWCHFYRSELNSFISTGEVVGGEGLGRYGLRLCRGRVVGVEEWSRYTMVWVQFVISL